MIRPFRQHLWLACLCLAATNSLAGPIISEFMADNKATLADEDGTYADWVEIHNPDAASINLEGWGLTDNATQPLKWVFPAVTLQPGDFLLVFASGKNRRNPTAPLHTNFSLNNGGEYLALVQPSGLAAHEFSPTFPQQREDVSFGSSFAAAALISSNSSARYHVATATSPATTTWTARTFADGTWTSGTSGFGFGLLIPGITVKEARAAAGVSIGNLATTDAVLAGNPGSSTTAQVDTQIRQVINLLGEGDDGRYSAANNAPNSLFALPGENHCLKATGFINFSASQTGIWTFHVNSDDGSRLKIDLNLDGDFGDAGEVVILDDAGHGPQDILRTATMTAGNHAFEFVFFEGGGGDEVELSAAQGGKSAWDSTFRLIGDTANGGLTATTFPLGFSTTSGAVISTNIQAAMQPSGGTARADAYFRYSFSLTANQIAAADVLGLSLRYNDGFIAWLNGVEIGRSNTPSSVSWDSLATASRDIAASLTAQKINASAAKSALIAGANVLAIQGLNTTAADNSFLVQAELTSGDLQSSGPYYFKQPTPRTINSTPASLGYVADTVFSHKRGLYTAPFSLSITSATPGATIRYTTDGSKPTATTGIAVAPPDANTPPTATIAISATTVIRAAAYKTNYDSTNIDTNTYLFLDDVIRQSATPAGWPTGPINGQVLNYGMDTTIVDNTDPTIGGVTQVKSALSALPSVCVSLPVASLTDAATGIYTHAGEDGFAWEREASIEMLNDGNTLDQGFQENCGIRIRGGYSRNANNPKHAFRIMFRSDYGDGSLDYPIFAGDDKAVTTFKKFDIQTAQNYSWSFEGDRNGNTFLREIWSRDAQVDLGQPGTRGRYVHLYLNGHYWGLYQIQERAEADWAASYQGGNDEDYDVIKVETSLGYLINPTAGDLNAWQSLWNQSRPFYSSPTLASYFRMQGLTSSGAPSTSDPVLLDVDNLIDYMLIVFFTGNSDAPLGGSGDFPNNYYSGRDRRGGKGFWHIQHDGEHSLNRGQADRTGPFSDPTTGGWSQFNRSNPQYLHQDLVGSTTATDKSGSLEYKTRFGDRVHKHFFNNGKLDYNNSLARLNRRAAQVEQAIIAESARWGDSKITPPALPCNANDWRTARNDLRNWFTGRHSTVLSQLVAKGLYPSIAAPRFNQHGGAISSTSDITMLEAGGTIYFTTDGSDPRLVGGALNNTASLFQTGTTQTITLVASGSTGATWRYLDNGTDQGTAWKELAFNDSTWKGPARGEFGYGDGDEITRIEDNPVAGYTASSTDRYITSYFRTSFTPTISGFDSLQVEVRYDDGVVVYLNGTEVGRLNMPTSPTAITYTTPALGSTPSETTFYTIAVPPSLLRAGNNVLAAEVHQSGATSSDVSFDLRLTARKTNFPQPLRLAGPAIVTVKSRARDTAGTNWSALNEAEFLVDIQEAAAANLVISEIMYHPANPSDSEIAAGFTQDDDFEFIELQNIGSQSIDLRECYFWEGISYTFPNTSQAVLPAGGRLILAKNPAGFAARYGVVILPFGEFKGTLDNAGERLTIKDPNGTIIKSFTYSDLAPWPTSPDGAGRSLVLRSPNTNPDQSLADNWRPSYLNGGSPTTSDATSYLAWKTSNAITLDQGDDDGDGLSNFYEYALGGSLTQSDTEAISGRTQPFTIETTTSDHFTLSFTRRLAAEDLAFTVETSPNLNSWSLQPSTQLSEIDNNDGTATVTLKVEAPLITQRSYVRLRAALR